MSAAQRRRGRRLRAALRHEQQSIAQTLATFTHHGAQRQKTDRARGWVRGEAHGQVPEEPTSQDPSTHFFLDDDSVPELGCRRPDRLADVRPQERVQRSTVKKIVDSVSVVPILHTFVLQLVDRWSSAGDGFSGTWQGCRRSHKVPHPWTTWGLLVDVGLEPRSVAPTTAENKYWEP